jgi:hypothetical protein
MSRGASPTMVAPVYAEAKCASIRKGRLGSTPRFWCVRPCGNCVPAWWWGLAELEAAAGLTPGNGRALVKVLRSEGLIEAAGRGVWE